MNLKFVFFKQAPRLILAGVMTASFSVHAEKVVRENGVAKLVPDDYVSPVQATATGPAPDQSLRANTVSTNTSSTASTGGVEGNAPTGTVYRDINGDLKQTTPPPATTSAGKPAIPTGSTIPTSSSPSINKTAKDTGSMNGMTAAISGVTAAVTGAGAVAAATRTPPDYPQAAILTGMMLMSVAQMAASQKTAKEANQTARQVESLGGGSGVYDDAGVLTPQEIGAIKRIQAELSSPNGINGLRIDAAGNVVMPDGKKFKPAALTNPKQSLGAGFSKAAMASALQVASKGEKEALARLEKIGSATEAQGFQEGSGGAGGGFGNGASGSGAAGYGAYASGLAAKESLERTPANQIAGMTKTFNGEQIGVGADDIFLMVQRRYVRKAYQEAFILGASAASTPR